MSARKKKGATLALVVTLTFFIVLLGVGFFMWLKLMGGGAELQHATDSGNLNVAVKVLQAPTVDLAAGDETLEFGGLVKDNKVNLLNYNKLAAKLALAEANAAAENKMPGDFPPGTEKPKDRVEKLARLLEGPGGIADRLYNQLSNHENLKDFFNSLSMSNSTRMMNPDNHQIDRAAETSVAYYAPAKASNVWFNPESLPNTVKTELIPPDGTDENKNSIRKNGKVYLKGYKSLDIDGLTLALATWAVPLRPGEQPHLIGLDEFAKRSSTPDTLTGNLESKVVPNSFKSGGSINGLAAPMIMKSAAVVGTLSAEFPASIPQGVIVIDNAAGEATGNAGSANVDVFKDYMMQPKCVDVMKMTMLNGDTHTYMSETPNKFNPTDGLQKKAKDTFHPGTFPTYDPFPMGVLDKIKKPDGSTLNGDDDWYFHATGVIPETYRSQFPGRNNWPVGAPQEECCDNMNSIASNPGSSPLCCENLPKILDVYGHPSGTRDNMGDMMSIEKFAGDVANGVPGSLGCALVWAPGGLDGVNGCTALKQYDHNKAYDPPGSLFNDQDGRAIDANTLQALIDQAGPSDIKARMVERLYQMNPTATPAAVDAVFTTNVKWNDLSFIYANGTGFAVGYTNKPGFLGTIKPDGKEDTAGLGVWNNALFKHVDFPSSRWEAPPEAGAFAEDVATWVPSSGAQNLLGVLRLKNCTKGGGNWCSP